MATATQENRTGKNGKNELDLDEMNAQMNQMRDEIEELSRKLASSGASTFEKAEQTIQKTSKQALDVATREFEGLEADLRREIRDNPLRAISIAAGVGFLAALLTRN